MDNLGTLRRFDGQIINALKVAPESLWSLSFRNLVRFYEEQLAGCPNDRLVELKAKVNAVKEIEQIFSLNRDLAPD